MQQPELTSLVGVLDNDGDRLFLLRMQRLDGTRGYLLRVGTATVFLTVGDLARLGTVIQGELVSANPIRFLVRMVLLLMCCAALWLLTTGVTGPLFAYPWSN